MSTFDREVLEHNEWFRSPRYKGIIRLYSADQVVEQRGTIPHDYTVARTAAEAFYPLLRELFDEAVHHNIRTVFAGTGSLHEAPRD